jgi:hypothetical protein
MSWPERWADCHGPEWHHFFGGTGISEIFRQAELTKFVSIIKYYIR